MTKFIKSNLVTQIKKLLELKTTHSDKSQGWVQSVRKHKNVVFLHLNDGSSTNHLQVVLPIEQYSEDIRFGSCVEVDGDFVKSPGALQPIEIIAKNITLLGHCDESFPIKYKQKQSFDSLRQYPHLRHRSTLLSAIIRLRSIANYAVHTFFQNEDFIHVNTPILTTNDCEGAGETFKVGVADENKTNELFFGVPTFLTVSSQLHLEVIASGLSRAYTIGPTFRAENNNTRHHVSEFTMVEAEVAFVKSVRDVTTIVEGLLKYVAEKLISSPDFTHVVKEVASPEHIKVVEKLISSPFISLPYADAYDIIKMHESSFVSKIKPGADLMREHEQFLVNHFDSIPVFVCDYPADIKPFYAKLNQDKKTVAAFDLLGPRVGEICGGSLREESLEVLESRIDQLKIKELDWYLDLRRYGTVPHGGFGVGFDRFLQVLLGVPNIRDIIPFPRYPNHCKL